MSFYSQANLEALYNRKFWICSKCYTTLENIPGEGFCCPKCKQCWWPKPDQDPPEVNKARCYQGGAIVYSGESKGRKRKKPRKRTEWAGIYGDV